MKNNKALAITAALFILALLLMLHQRSVSRGAGQLPEPFSQSTLSAGKLNPGSIGKQQEPADVMNETASFITGGADSDQNKPEISAGEIPAEEAARLKRENYEAYLRYRQRIGSPDNLNTATDPEARKKSAESRVQKRVSALISAAAPPANSTK